VTKSGKIGSYSEFTLKGESIANRTRDGFSGDCETKRGLKNDSMVSILNNWRMEKIYERGGGLENIGSSILNLCLRYL
jgi:hypothetical protein